MIANAECTQIKTSGLTLLSEGRTRRQPGPGSLRYGLPCAKCRLYYTTELTVCPICNCEDRVPPATALLNLASML
jgi:hypothetical protein